MFIILFFTASKSLHIFMTHCLNRVSTCKHITQMCFNSQEKCKAIKKGKARVVLVGGNVVCCSSDHNLANREET